MNIKTMLNNRTVSSFGLSIGTALALESIFGIDDKVYDNTREIPKCTISNYDYYYINIYTLVRNIYTSVSSTDLSIILNNKNHTKFIEEVLYSEIEVIENLFSRLKDVTVVYYMPDYSKVSNKKFIRANSKLPRKEEIHINTTNIKKNIFKQLKDINVNYLEDDYKFVKEHKNILVTTHISPDLLNKRIVNKLHLLESHTGVVKTEIEFNGKYPKSKVIDTSILPFNEILLRLLGDGLIFENPIQNFRRDIDEIAHKYKWTPHTTESKVIGNLKTNTDLKDAVNRIIQYEKKYI